VFRSSRLLGHRTSFAAGLTALCAAAVASASALQTPPPQLNLAEVQSSFACADAESDGRLDRRQADSAGVSGDQFAQFDTNSDGLLDAEEYLVARQALAARSGRAVAGDLAAESTRIQAAWRARRSPGPSLRVELARRAQQPQVQVGESSPKPASQSPAPDLAAPRAPIGTAPSTTAASPPAVAPGLGLSRLTQGAGAPDAQQSGASLEDRARSAQELILARRMQSGAPAREPVVIGPSQGPASRTAVAETTRPSAPAVGKSPRTQQAPPGVGGARSKKPRSETGKGGN